MNDQFLTELQNVMGGSGIFMEEPMKKHTTFRVGGPADVLVQPDETALVAILALCRQYHVSYSFIGNGSNLLVGDKGIRGVVIEMTDPMGNIEVDGTKITAQAGAMLSKIANTAASNGLGGMEFAAGIPGSVGGAVVMNAGAYGGEMKDIIEKVYVLDENGAQLELDRDALDLGYRHSCIPEKKYIVTKVVLELVPRNEAEIRSEMKELHQPDMVHIPPGMIIIHRLDRFGLPFNNTVKLLCTIFFQSHFPSRLIVFLPCVHRNTSWTLMNTQPYNTHSFPRIKVTSGTIKLPEFE